MPNEANTSSKPMVQITGLQKSYGQVVALQELDLTVPTGEFLTLLGPSGSGKTTLLNLIAGMTSATSGRIWINGRDVTDVAPEKRGLGMVFQNYALMPHMTVFDNIAFPLQIRKMPKAQIRQRVNEALEVIRLPHVANRKPKELSGGQQQRVSIARCLVYKPDLILMDEPLGALDKKLREQMQLEIRRIHTEFGITMLYVTHDQEEALNMSDRIILMNGGAVEQLGTPNNLYFEPRTQFTAEFIGASTLLDATVASTGAPASFVLEGGLTSRAILHEPVAAGARGKLLLRPEALRIVSPDEVPPGRNSATGILESSLVTGGTSSHFVKLPSGTTMLVRELTSQKATSIQAGTPVTVTWPDGAGRFLQN